MRPAPAPAAAVAAVRAGWAAPPPAGSACLRAATIRWHRSRARRARRSQRRVAPLDEQAAGRLLRAAAHQWLRLVMLGKEETTRRHQADANRPTWRMPRAAYEFEEGGPFVAEKSCTMPALSPNRPADSPTRPTTRRPSLPRRSGRGGQSSLLDARLAEMRQAEQSLQQKGAAMIQANELAQRAPTAMHRLWQGIALQALFDPAGSGAAAPDPRYQRRCSFPPPMHLPHLCRPRRHRCCRRRHRHRNRHHLMLVSLPHVAAAGVTARASAPTGGGSGGPRTKA